MSKPEKMFVEIMLNGAVVARKQIDTSKKLFFSIMLKSKKR